MAMLVSASFWLRCVNALPNIGTGSMHLVALVIGSMLEVIPGLGAGFFAYGNKLSERSIERGENRQKQIEALVAKENQAAITEAQSKEREAKNTAETKKTIAPTRIKKAEHDSAAKQTEHQVKAEKTVIGRKERAENRIVDARTEGRKQVIDAYEKQGEELQAQIATNRKKEQAIAHKTNVFSETTAHFEKMITLNKGLAGAADTNAATAQTHAVQVQKTNKSILELNRATQKVIEAETALNKALGDYDQKVAEGAISINHDTAIREAMIKALEAEGQLDTIIETSQIEHKSELRQIYQKDVADKNRELDGVLAKCSKQTLDKITNLITAEISAQQKTIGKLTSPEDIKSAQEHLIKLNALLEQTNHIQPSEPTSEQRHTPS
jgi:hypothetical protein